MSTATSFPLAPGFFFLRQTGTPLFPFPPVFMVRLFCPNDCRRVPSPFFSVLLAAFPSGALFPQAFTSKRCAPSPPRPSLGLATAFPTFMVVANFQGWDSCTGDRDDCLLLPSHSCFPPCLARPAPGQSRLLLWRCSFPHSVPKARSELCPSCVAR